jgi:carbamoyl-phosphate synthase large subunit
LIGVDLEAIELAENRERFKKLMIDIGMHVAPSYIANSYLEGMEAAQKIDSLSN